MFTLSWQVHMLTSSSEKGEMENLFHIGDVQFYIAGVLICATLCTLRRPTMSPVRSFSNSLSSSESMFHYRLLLTKYSIAQKQMLKHNCFDRQQGVHHVLHL